MNGHQFFYKKNIKSQQIYAEKNGYEYICVKKPSITHMGKECAWLKISLIIIALQKNYDWVVFLDADVSVQPDTPPITDIEIEKKYLYVAKGYSNRINSGVLIIKNNNESALFFTNIMNNIDTEIPPDDDVGWGENGHIIHFSKQVDFIYYLDKKWNNNSDPTLDDYMRHYSHGPIKTLFTPSFFDKTLFYTFKYRTFIYKKSIRLMNFLHLCKKKNLNDNLHVLTHNASCHYIIFNTSLKN